MNLFVLKPVFHINNPVPDTANTSLALQFLEKTAVIAQTDLSGSQLYQLFYFHFDEWSKEVVGALGAIGVIQNTKPISVRVSYNFSANSIIPIHLFEKAMPETLIDSLFPFQEDNLVITDSVPEWQMHLATGVYKPLKQWVDQQWPTAKSVPSLKLNLSNIGLVNDAGKAILNFDIDSFCLTVVRNNKLLLHQHYDYSTPADVIFHLLFVSQQLGLNAQEISLELTGLLDKESPLYKEIYQYFLNVSFKDSNWEKANEIYPSHYFTTVNELAQCGL